MKGSSLNDRIRIERRADIVSLHGQTSSELQLTWDTGEPIHFDDGAPVTWDPEAWDPADDPIGDGAGNTLGDFIRIGPPSLRCQINELNGDETILAEKMQGVSLCMVVVRASALTRSLTSDDRLYDLFSRRYLNIRNVPKAARDAQFLSLLCEAGVAT